MAAVEVKASPQGVPGAVADPSAVHAEMLTYPGSGGTAINAYLARPSAPPQSAMPAMIVIHEAGGLGEHIKDVCNRFAALRYLALGVDLYTREGGPPPMDDVQALMERLFSMSDETVLGDLDGAAELLRAREDCSARVGCIGFCMGGRYTLLFAVARDRLDAAVDCWGGFIDKATPEERHTSERPVTPLELAPRLGCPLYAAFGEEDQNPSPALAGPLTEAAAKSGHEVLAEVYERAGHAFFADYRPSYRPEAAQRLWEHVVPFLDRHLRGGERTAAA
jgi:carboxymethylenebutenolidase